MTYSSRFALICVLIGRSVGTGNLWRFPRLVACPTESLSGGDTELTIAKCGYQELRDRGIPVIDLKQKENARCTVAIENGVVFDKINTWELVRDADAIITVPVMKTHGQTEVTLGMKNLKGLLIDPQKKDFHKRGLIEGVVDWCLHLKPCLEILSIPIFFNCHTEVFP